ncbi:hypothetical protein M9H77_34941 [Catharanthus roseus]|uniref:Uncharacterized protein n=1 Tax=Catharanthus roseus TaxID=4058 RepID=A0ACB9ZMM1_CATRO|nr:hypothetical protein M9H77_34941 [Catharanthus roseus]
MENILDHIWMYRERGSGIKGLTRQFINEEETNLEEPPNPKAEKLFERLKAVETLLVKFYELQGRPKRMLRRRRLMRRVENVVSKVSVLFDEHMRWLFEHNHLEYIPFPMMMPLVRAVISVDPSTSSSTAAIVGTSEVPTPDSSILPFYSCSQTHHSFTRPMDGALPSSRYAI